MTARYPTVGAHPALRGSARVSAGVRPTHAVRRLAEVGLASVSCGAAAIAILQVLPAAQAMNPVSEPISKYALTEVGWLFDIGVLALALGVVGVLAALVLGRCLAVSSTAFVALAACCLGLIALVVFPDDTVAGQLTTIGWVHWMASVAAFGGPAVAPIMLAHRHHRRSRCSRLPAAARWLAVVAGGWFVILLTGSVLEVTSHLPVWRVGGVVERCLAATEIAIAVVLAVWAWRGCPCATGRRRSPGRAGAASGVRHLVSGADGCVNVGAAG